MANDKILMKAKANKLGIAGYRTMSLDELSAAIKSAEGTTPAKGKTTPTANGSAPVKGKTSTTPAKGKGKTSTSAPAKSTPRKSSATPSAAKGKAKRPTTAASPKRTTAKRATANTPKTTNNGKKGNRVFIERTEVDWKAETNVGKTGKRKLVMDALRKYNGNYDKCWDALVGNAKKWYPQHTKDKAEQMVTWLIARVAYDFVMNTEQHTPGKRAAYGTSTAAQARAKARKPAARKKAAPKRATAKRGTAKRAGAKR